MFVFFSTLRDVVLGGLLVGLLMSKLICSLVTSLDNGVLKDIDEVVFLNHIRVTQVIIALQEDIELSLLHAVSLESQALEAGVLEASLVAGALALREDAKHEFNLAVKGSQLPRDLHNDLLLELFAEDQIVSRLGEEVLP